ncbi:hypothetical protein [Nocardiopsis sp. HUAS JQ3]|uniref:hypothetical protein n=1 Tax=Nocardiopsis sp. HUAS JQ3 TaxID=3061629 RepID=UPI0023A9A114|nr:hypothetical protein [Nocardiopsis sp. HUAS JQ3]WDZ94097.1 hypothetical protein PV789_16895 [Nocardiopsis sp. HUAS JQ3]
MALSLTPFPEETAMGKHGNQDQDGHQPGRPVPPPTPDSGGSGGGRHERDEDDR